MKRKSNMKEIGIIVGRFQVPSLHIGHLSLIDSALREFPEGVMIFLGTPKDGTLGPHDPLPYEARRTMIQEAYQDEPIRVFPLPDLGDWSLWVPELDRRVGEVLGEDTTAVMLGSRDSFILRYSEFGGRFRTQEIPEIPGKSGTQTRSEFLKGYTPRWTKEERELCCWLNSL